MYNQDMEKSRETKKSGGLKQKAQKIKAKLLSTYYGNPIKDMKLIVITGTTGKTIVAHYVHEILRAKGEQVAVLASDQPFKMGMLHKFLSDAWKAGANYVVVTAPTTTLKDNIFYKLPINVAAMTNFVTTSLTDMLPEEYIESESTLFRMKPENVVLNHDDINYESFSTFNGKKATYDYGLTGTSVKVLSSKLYKKGTEATVSVNSEIVTLATFIPGETSVSYMACAAAIAQALSIDTDSIIDGIANYSLETTEDKK